MNGTIFWRDPSLPIDGSSWDDLIKHDRLRGLYFDSRTSSIRATVLPRPNELIIQAQAPIELVQE